MLDIKEREEMDLRQELNAEMKRAMREKDQLTLSTIRLIMAAVKEKDIQARTQGANETATDAEILSLLQSMIKQREDSAATYIKGGREDLAKRERDEIEVIQGFLPEQISDAELGTVISGVISDTGATDIKDMGKVMGVLKSRYAGQIDMGKASGLVKNKLAKK